MPEPVSSDPMLPRILSPEWAVILVVDVQNDFCHENGVMGRLGFEMGPIQSSVRMLDRFIEAGRRAKVPIVFIATQHSEWTNSQAWLTRGPRRGGEICAVGTWGADFYGINLACGDAVVVKHRYSGFVGTDLDTVLHTRERRSVLVTGVSTNVCVESTVRDACMHDYHAVLVDDCCGAMTHAEHEAALHNVGSYFGRVLDSKTIMDYWQTLREATVH